MEMLASGERGVSFGDEEEFVTTGLDLPVEAPMNKVGGAQARADAFPCTDLPEHKTKAAGICEKNKHASVQCVNPQMSCKGAKVRQSWSR